MTQPPIPMAQDVTWRQKTGYMAMGAPTFTDHAIKCRMVFKRRTVKNKQGQDTVSEALMSCLEAVGPEDRITYKGKDWPVIAVGEYPDLEGKVWWYEVAL
jgi:hypothetical protein